MEFKPPYLANSVLFGRIRDLDDDFGVLLLVGGKLTANEANLICMHLVILL